MSIASARRMAEALVAAQGIQEASVPVDDIARRLGLQIVRANLGVDVSGVLVLDGASAYICVQQREPYRRRRFTIAHELGHFVLRHRFEQGTHVHVDRGSFVIQRGPSASTGLDRIEVEANQFAASLLMPESFIRVEVAKLGAEPLTEPKVAALAKTFEVSEQSMTIRLTSLGYL